MSKQCIYYAERRVVVEYIKAQTRCGEELHCRFIATSGNATYQTTYFMVKFLI